MDAYSKNKRKPITQIAHFNPVTGMVGSNKNKKPTRYTG
jgi:hypothetical protein